MAGEGKLKGKVAIVTGGSRGIGRNICLALASDGASVVVNYQGNKAAADETVSMIEASGGKAVAHKGDVSVAADVLATFDKAVEAFGGVNIVVHVAGILLDHCPNVKSTTEEEWDRIFAINARGTFLVAREAVKRLGPGGRIITTSGSVVAIAVPGYAAYSASKSAVETFTRILSKELRDEKITANCVAPGPVATDMFLKGQTKESIDFFASQSPLGRLGEPKDISAVVQFLASDAAEWINGQVIRLNGGMV